MQSNNDITIEKAYKDEKVNVTNTPDYIKACTDHWENEIFYEKLHYEKNIENTEMMKKNIDNFIDSGKENRTVVRFKNSLILWTSKN